MTTSRRCNIQIERSRCLHALSRPGQLPQELVSELQQLLVFVPLFGKEAGEFQQQQEAEGAFGPDEIHGVFELGEVEGGLEADEAEMLAGGGFGEAQDVKLYGGDCSVSLQCRG